VLGISRLGIVPFPDFRVILCIPRANGIPRTVLAVGAASSTSEPSPSAQAKAATVGRTAMRPPATRVPGLRLPWPGRVLGVGLGASHPWQLLRTVLLAMLIAANLVLLVLRRQVGRAWKAASAAGGSRVIATSSRR
jgi:hypothetical protein